MAAIFVVYEFGILETKYTVFLWPLTEGSLPGGKFFRVPEQGRTS
jgi:hypothetical protein